MKAFTRRTELLFCFIYDNSSRLILIGHLVMTVVTLWLFLRSILGHTYIECNQVVKQGSTRDRSVKRKVVGDSTHKHWSHVITMQPQSQLFVYFLHFNYV